MTVGWVGVGAAEELGNHNGLDCSWLRACVSESAGDPTAQGPVARAFILLPKFRKALWRSLNFPLQRLRVKSQCDSTLSPVVWLAAHDKIK